MARILIVDDDRAFGELARQRLTLAGHTADFHQGAFGTLNKAVDGYDALVLDVYMPALNGTGLAQEVRRTPELNGIKIVLVSSMDSERLRKTAQQCGADGFVSKSTSRGEFVTAVEAVLKPH